MAFSIRHFLRQIPTPTLKTYFESRQALIPSEWWGYKEPKLAAELFSYLMSDKQPEVARDILAEIIRVEPMANARGRRALLNASAGHPEIPERFGRLENDAERAMWMLMTHGELFRSGEEVLFFDFRAWGSWGRHYRTSPDLAVSRDADDIRAFEAEVCQFYRRRDGSGVSCHIEFTDRHQDGSIQITLYVQGLPNNTTEFVDGTFVRRVSNPALEAAIVYDPAVGHTSTVAKGGKEVHEVLRQTFARKLLKIEPKFDVLERRPFKLDALKARLPLVADAALGVKAVRVRKLKLAPANLGAGHLTIEAPSGVPDTSVYDLGNRWFAEQSELYKKFRVIHAHIAMHFHPKPEAKKSKTINIELTIPNGPNLNDLPDADRRIAEAHIEKWKLIEPAA